MYLFKFLCYYWNIVYLSIVAVEITDSDSSYQKKLLELAQIWSITGEVNETALSLRVRLVEARGYSLAEITLHYISLVILR